ncbi:hypothetical protein ABFG93_16780 [Pseudalkalibacillus hwajinpoensis]|uniref:hypothetical protein n=1 Tax=Guptibacillus hwajinpoensis TaxID=208199 RepID=UPI00325B6C1A
MEDRLEKLRTKMLDTKAVSFDDRHKQNILSTVNRAPSAKGFLMLLKENLPAYLTYVVLLIMLTGTGLFAASEADLLPLNATPDQVKLTKEELYNDVLGSITYIDDENDRYQVRSIASTYLANFNNWRISEMNSQIENHHAILIQGKITEGYFNMTTFTLWIEPKTGLPLNFVIRNQESSVIEEFTVPREAVSKGIGK